MTTITDKKQYPGEQYLNELITNIEFAARAPVEVVRAMAAELQKRREADSAEPVAYIFKHPAGKLFWALTDESNKEQSDVIPVYAAPPVPVVPAALPENDDEDGHDIDYLEPSEVYSLGRTAGWNACRAAMLHGAEPVSQTCKLNEPSGNSPVTPDGWVIVPKKLTAENGAKGVLSGEFSETTFISCPECFGDDDCDTCDGSGRIEIKVPVTWTTIKSIWDKGIAHFAAKPPQEVKRG
ncbi:hypothetical protein [Escherichia coli]|uniref:hypothetical protein n=1 Tax=Escherichia coli TaxID=562 RepID=UPI0009F91D34|nr:hypothetical protein [Escherichia coli]ORD15717.1 hypothetical protein A4T37_12920 [Escherichia coli]